MEKITAKLLQSISNNLMLELEKDEYELLAEEFYIILEQMKLVQAITVDDYEPMHYPIQSVHTFLRPDRIGESNDQEQVLKNAWQTQGDYIVINKVIT